MTMGIMIRDGMLLIHFCPGVHFLYA
jgi:hypothetical protein